jgi:hydroxyacylglutathione hydrolase
VHEEGKGYHAFYSDRERDPQQFLGNVRDEGHEECCYCDLHPGDIIDVHCLDSEQDKTYLKEDYDDIFNCFRFDGNPPVFLYLNCSHPIKNLPDFGTFRSKPTPSLFLLRTLDNRRKGYHFHEDQEKKVNLYVVHKKKGNLTMEIVPGIHQIDGVQGNCYIIARDSLVLIDTGLPRSSKKILGYIRDTLKRDPSELSTIILTHYHIDHTGNVRELKTLTRAKVAVHDADADFVAGKKTPPAPQGRLGLPFRIISMFFRPAFVEPDIRLKNGDTIAGLTCIHTPGHTPGSICLFDPAAKVLFAGDILKYDGEKISGAPPQFTMDVDEAQRSMNKIALLDFEILLCGHGIPLTSGAAGKVRDFVQSLS